MKEYLNDYNAMFGTSFTIDNISAYNKNLNTRLARKEKKYLSRDQQLDLVIVVDRLLTGFDAPCLSTIFMGLYRHFPGRTGYLIRISSTARW